MKKLLAALALLPLTASLAYAQAPDIAAAKTQWEGFGTSCKNCHGKLGEGGFGPDLAGRSLSGAQFQRAVRKPWGVMPAFTDAQVTDAELTNMAAYFSGLPRNAAPAEPRVPVDPASSRGKQLFAGFGCAQCHGATFDRGRADLGGAAADFGTFKDLVYRHTDVIEKFDESLEGPPPPPAPGAPVRHPQMGNFNSLRLSETQVKEIFDWAHDELGYRPNLVARFTPNGATYTLELSNNGIAGKGTVGTGLTIDLPMPAGVTVVSATGDGYKGVTANGAEWQISKLAPKDKVTLTVTLSRPVTAADKLAGSIRWAKPMPKSGPNMDVVNFQPALGRPPG